MLCSVAGGLAGVGFVSAHVEVVIPHTGWFLTSLVLHMDGDGDTMCLPCDCKGNANQPR